MMRSETSLGRKLLFPLLIIAGAVALAMWATHSDSSSQDAVERYVRQLCLESSTGGDTKSLLALSDPYVAEAVSHQIANVCAVHEGHVEDISIQVMPGDIHPFAGSETATHSALIGDGHVDMLGLRLSVRGNGSSVRILGYWIPQS